MSIQFFKDQMQLDEDEKKTILFNEEAEQLIENKPIEDWTEDNLTTVLAYLVNERRDFSDLLIFFNENPMILDLLKQDEEYQHHFWAVYFTNAKPKYELEQMILFSIQPQNLPVFDVNVWIEYSVTSGNLFNCPLKQFLIGLQTLDNELYKMFIYYPNVTFSLYKKKVSIFASTEIREHIRKEAMITFLLNLVEYFQTHDFNLDQYNVKIIQDIINTAVIENQLAESKEEVEVYYNIYPEPKTFEKRKRITAID